MSTPEPWTFKAIRLCVFCHTSYDYPLTDEDRWTAIPIGGSRDEYWRCPDCTAQDTTQPRG